MAVARAGLLLSFIAFTAVSAQSTPDTTFDGAAFSSTADQLLEAARRMPPDPKYAAQVLFEQGTYKIAPDGRLAYEHRMIYRVDSEEGVKGWAEISGQWDPWYEAPAQLHARVLPPGGRFVELDQKTITDAPVKADDSETFSSTHVRRAPLPGVKIGSIVEEVETTEEKTPYFGAGEVYRFAFSRYVPIGRERLVVDLPAAMPFKDAPRNVPDLKVDRTEAGGRRHIVYAKTNLPPVHESDIDLSTNDAETAAVEFATGVSWAQVAAEYNRLADPQTIPSQAESIMPRNLPADRAGKLRAIVEQLHREIRYTGVEFGQARLQPQSPAEVIKRHYGDCKDKATLLVAMLRSAGIPANLALLSTGPGWDVSPDLPGMSLFDHAIVYVPAAADGQPGSLQQAMFIDATATFHEVGTLPYQDQGRHALVIAPETQALMDTPPPSPADSTLVETRTYTLSQLGPAQVEEVSKTHGYIDASYRSTYGGTDNEKLRADMLGYVQRAYLAKAVPAVTHGKGDDLAHPFELKLNVTGAKRGTTTMTEAVVAIFPTGTVSLPKWFAEAPPLIGPDTPAFEKQDIELATKSRAATYAIEPFTSEQQTRIHIPDGFVPRTLPADKVTHLGPATLTETYKSDAGLVIADFRFDSGPSTITAAQALAMRDAMLELQKREYVAISFDQVGAKALAAGKIREALESDRALIAAHPSEAVHHVRLAHALLEAGIGDEAHEEARKATRLDPKSARAFSTLGWTLQHNDLGERFGKGFDRAGAIAAYKQAILLDPEDNDQRFDLAVLQEFDAHGIRYAADADMPAAIAGYRELVARTEKTEPAVAQQDRENLLYALLFARQFAELDKMLATLPESSSHTTMAITSAAAQHGAAAGIAAAGRGNVPATERNKDLRLAGNQLAGLRLYAEAAEILTAGMQGGDDAPTVARQVELYRSLKIASLKPLPASDPKSPVQRVTVGMMDGSLTREQAEGVLSNQAYASPAAKQRDVKKTISTIGFMRTVAAKTGFSEAVLLDLIAGNMTYTATGDDKTGYAIVVQSPGSAASRYFVVKEDGSYRIVSDEHDNIQVGNAVLYALKHDNPAQAKALLDWKRDFTHKGATDDAFYGPLLPRFWTIGSAKPGADSPEAMRLAALALIAGSMEAGAYLPELLADREKASGQSQTELDLLLAVAGVGAEKPEIALPAAKRLLEQEPDSLTALRLAGESFALEHDTAGWQAMLAPRLAKKPGDHDLLAQQARAYAAAHDFAAAQATAKKVLDSGKAEAVDYNEYAWLGLFSGKLDDDVSKAAQQGSMIAKNASFAELHTLACIYAAQGKTTEARQIVEQAMYAGSQAEPNSAVWYVLGLIYEQYGAKTAALNAYKRVQAHESDDHTFVDATSTYVLAQERISKLGSS